MHKKEATFKNILRNTAFVLLVFALLVPQSACRATEQELFARETAFLTTAPTPTAQVLPSPTPKPGIDEYRAGYGDDYGYFSRYFNFGFALPYSWTSFERGEIDELNNLQTKRYYGDDYLNEVIDRLKSGESLYEYYAYNIATAENVTIYVTDYSAYPDEVVTELSFLKSVKDWLQDPQGDGTGTAENLRLETVTLLGVEHPVYRYDTNVEGFHYAGAFLVIKQGTSFAQINMLLNNFQRIKDVFHSFYPFPDGAAGN